MEKGMILIFAVFFVAAGVYLAVYGYQNWQSKNSYDQAKDLAGFASEVPMESPVASPEATPVVPEQTVEPLLPPEPTPTPDPVAEVLAQTDLAALREVNPDVIGWIEIPDTVLSYPIMQGTDNDYYLNHTWKGASSAVGSIYMDYRNDAGFSDFNTIIYGHRMGNGTMFNSLHNYEDSAYWEDHPAVYVVTDEGVRRYEIFASYEADAVKKHTYRLGLVESEGQQAYINYCIKRTVLDTGIVPEPGDHILTMSTCVGAGSGYDTRWVVQAVYRNAEKGE